ncbi:homocysteine S-methyltransferase family protein [Klebsiella pneumoniae]|nr:homocysteine S-methyltransferase family protein [Klebsiella pneumoniae]
MALAASRPKPYRLVTGRCALRPDELRQYVQELSRIAECYVTAHANAGLPNAFGRPRSGRADTMATQIREWAEAGFINIVGGCCGTTPEHIAAMSRGGSGPAAASVAGNCGGLPPRRLWAVEPSATIACSLTSVNELASPARRSLSG